MNGTSGVGYRTVGLLLALLGVLSFSIRPVLVKVAYAYARDPVTLLALRMVFSLPFFAVAAWWLERNGPATPISTRDKWAIVGLGIIGYYLASFFDYLSLQYITAGLSRLIHFTYPTVVVVLGMFFLHKTPRVMEVLALILTYAGLAVMLLSTVEGQHEFLALGAAMSFGSAVSYAVYLFVGTQVIQRVGSMRFAAYALLVSSFCCILQFFVLRPLDALRIPAEVYWISFVIATVSTVLPIFAIAEALKRLGANTVAIMCALGPVSAMVLGYLGLEEIMTGRQIFGAALVVLGVVLVTLRPAR